MSQSISEKTKKEYEELRFNNAENDLAALWGTVKTVLKWDNKGPPTALSVDGTMITKPKELAETMNKFFIKKIIDLKKNIPNTTEDPCSKLRESMKDRKSIFNLKPITPDKVEEIIKS